MSGTTSPTQTGQPARALFGPTCRSAPQSGLSARALTDPYYAALATTGATDAHLARAGFFDDGLGINVRSHPSWALEVPTTPVGKLRGNLSKAGAGRPLVLLTTGAFSPVHNGHLALLERARLVCEKAGRHVVGGYFSASHDHYVSTKQGGHAALHCENRIALLEEAVSQNDWLDVCPWEARYAPTALNFTDVLARLQAYLALQLMQDVEVAYVFGSDNLGFLEAFLERGIAVCVHRAGVGAPSELPVPLNCQDRWYFGRAADCAASSTLVREGALSLVPSAAQARYAALGPPKPDGGAKPLYLVRQDGTHALRNWPSVPARAGRFFDQQIRELLQQVFDKAGASVEVYGLDLCRQKGLLEGLSHDHAVLSLDVCATASANLGVSRAFYLSGGQVTSTQMVARPGTVTLSEQLSRVPFKPWLVVDDDKASGFTERTVTDWLLSQGHELQGFSYLNRMLLSENGMGGRAVMDVVDSRDFLLGAADVGLVVRICEGVLARAPYILPFVNLVFRAKVPPEQVYQCCLDLWRVNAAWFEAFAPELTVADADAATRELLLALKFSPEVRLGAVATHMGAWLQSCHWPLVAGLTPN